MVYLVDFENVNSAGLAGVQKLTKEDKVYIFYTVNATSLSFTAHLNLLSCPAEVIYYYVASGTKNALDFQLASFLGYLISQGTEKDFCIISNDRGYEHVKNFWEKNGLASGIYVGGAPSISRALPMEKPFTARIQQKAPSVQNKPADVPRPQETIDAAKKQGVKPAIESASVNSPLSKPAPDTKAPAAAKVPETAAPISDNKAQTAAVPSADAAKPVTEAAPAPKKRGRPKRTPEKTAVQADPVSEILKSSLEKAGIPFNEKNSSEITALLKRSEGKQQFYRGLISIFGMENGVEVYKSIRPEYTNLTKLAKQ